MPREKLEAGFGPTFVNGLEGQTAWGDEVCGRSSAGNAQGRRCRQGLGRSQRRPLFIFFFLIRKLHVGFLGYFWKRGIGRVWGSRGGRRVLATHGKVSQTRSTGVWTVISETWMQLHPVCLSHASIPSGHGKVQPSHGLAGCHSPVRAPGGERTFVEHLCAGYFAYLSSVNPHKGPVAKICTSRSQMRAAKKVK